MFVIAEAGTTVVRLDDRFDAPQARSLEELLTVLGPIRVVVISFAKVREVDDAAVASLARTVRAFPESQVTIRGLSRHLRRVLRYVGLDADGAGAREGAAPAARASAVDGHA